MKKAYTIDQQIARLKSNGMTFDDEEKAKEILLDVGYYRLGFYSFPYEIKFPCLEHRDHQLKPGTTFKSVYDLYEFDTRLIIWRSLVQAQAGPLSKSRSYEIRNSFFLAFA